MALKDLSHTDLAALAAAANRAQEAAIETDDDALYAAACRLARIYRTEIWRRLLAADQAELDALNAAIASIG